MNELFDFTTLFKNFYNTENTLDFTKEEDVKKLENAVKILKENTFFASLFGDELLDKLLKEAHDKYEEANKQKAPQRPSKSVQPKVQANIKKLATEYIDTMIKPYIKDLNENQYNELIDSLYEFGCWIFNKKD